LKIGEGKNYYFLIVSMKELSIKELKIRVKNWDYTDNEWNQYSLYRYVDYQSHAIVLKTAIKKRYINLINESKWFIKF